MKQSKDQILSQTNLVLLLMAAATNSSATKRYAVVTGANKGIGFEVCRQLACHGITVVLTARDEKRGLDALEKLKSFGFSDTMIFHQLDVANSSSVDSLAQFIKTQFGKLDILVNNAGISGAVTDVDAFRAFSAEDIVRGKVNWGTTMTDTYDLAEECLQINYYGTKAMVEAFVPLLEISQSPRIVNVSSTLGQLKNIPGERARIILNDPKNLTEERVDEVLDGLLKDLKEGCVAAKGWPLHKSAYILSKAAMNAYTRMLAAKYPDFKVNCVCPGFVKTDFNYGVGIFTAEEAAESIVRLALLPDDSPSGLFFEQNQVTSFE